MYVEHMNERYSLYFFYLYRGWGDWGRVEGDGERRGCKETEMKETGERL